MLPISELVRFASTLDDDWHSPVADAAAEQWGVQRPVFVRSSASHVFVARAGAGEPGIVLRLRPDTPEHVAVLERGARAAAAWAAAGAPFADAVASTAGELVERVGGCAVTALVAAEGDPLDALPVEPVAARAWGAALARVHAVRQPDTGFPTAEQLVEVGELPAELERPAEEIREALGNLPRGSALRGVLHGDPEPDNVICTSAGPVLVDPDEVRVGWFASDVAFALRDWQDADGLLDWAAGAPAAFLEGYRSVRPLGRDELAMVPLLVRAAALEDLSAMRRHLRTPAAEDWPGWAVDLRAKLETRAAQLTRVVLRGSANPRRQA